MGTVSRRRVLGETDLGAHQEKMIIVAMPLCHQELQSLNLGQTHCFAFFQQNYKISRVQGRQQMLMYLDFGTAAHEIAKNGSNSPK